MAKENIVLCDLSDANNTISELRDEWIIDVLLTLNISESVVEMGFDSESRKDFLYEMNEVGISIELYSSGEVDVHKKVWIDGNTEETSGWLPATDKHLVAQWKKPEKIRRIDGKEVYYELHLKEWCVKI